MKQASRFIIFLAVVFIFIFLMSLLLPSKVTIAKSVLINAPIEKVQNQLIHFDQWKNWYPAFKDENVIVKNSSNPNSVRLTNNRRKNVDLTITQPNPYLINVDVRSSSSERVTYEFILTPKAGNKIQLTWNINAQLGWYPWNRIWGIFLDKVSGSQYELALEDLKKVVEN